MSAANTSAAAGTGHVRHADDFYSTPSWVTRAILPHLPLRSGRVLEPSAGDGAIVRELLECGVDRHDIVAVELDPGRAAKVPCTTHAADFLDLTWPERTRFSLTIMNPPFALAREFVEACIPIADTVVALLRLGFLASQGRAAWLRRNTPDVYVLPRRPSFTGDGKTDSSDYCWAVWGRGRGGRITWLECEPNERRRVSL